MRISDWSSDVCSSDLRPLAEQIIQADKTSLLVGQQEFRHQFAYLGRRRAGVALYEAVDQSIDRFGKMRAQPPKLVREGLQPRSEEHTSELQSLLRISYAVFCLKKKTPHNKHNKCPHQTH